MPEMPDECYPSRGLLADGKLVLRGEPWQNLQKYIVDVTNLPQLPDPQAQPIFDTLHQAAEELKTDGLPKANELANNLYNFGTTVESTFRGLTRLMEQAEPPKPAIEQLLGNLQSMASSAEEAVPHVAAGLASFLDKTTAGGNELAALLEAGKRSIAQASGMIMITAQHLEQQVSAPNLDVAAIEMDVQKIQQATAQLAGVRLAGLAFPVEPGVEAGTAAAEDANALGQAWHALVTQLTELVKRVKDPEADLKQEPCLSEFQLAAASRAWKDIAGAAHGVMLNFYVTPQSR
jgi:hypothetical protein